jgi:2-polyprenyl-6-methoxyphenol hydroxylase-like FAD-dependent oxidoreductase
VSTEYDFLPSDSVAVIESLPGTLHLMPVFIREWDKCQAVKVGEQIYVADTMPGFRRFERSKTPKSSMPAVPQTPPPPRLNWHQQKAQAEEKAQREANELYSARQALVQQGRHSLRQRAMEDAAKRQATDFDKLRTDRQRQNRGVTIGDALKN